MDRRSLLKYSSAAAFGTLAIGMVSGTETAAAATAGAGIPGPYVPLPNPAVTPVPNPRYPKNLTFTERKNLKTFDELDFVVFSNQDWARMGESHSRTVRVHMPDGSFTDGLDNHITALKALFLFAPDTRIDSHPIRIAKNDLTAVTGVEPGRRGPARRGGPPPPEPPERNS